MTSLRSDTEAMPAAAVLGGAAFGPKSSRSEVFLYARQSPGAPGIVERLAGRVRPIARQDRRAFGNLRQGPGDSAGFKPQWRGQAHGSYKFFFNAFYGE